VADDQGLEALLVAAGEAPPGSRIMYRDEIAAYGEGAIRHLAGDAWLFDPRYAAFAIRTIQRAGELGARESAIEALQNARHLIVDPRHLADLDESLRALGARSRAAAHARPSERRPPTAVPMSVDDLVVGTCYGRTSLHLAGLGGNRQKGISYPAGGAHVLLFSDASKVTEYGYKDQPIGDSGYRYFGEWSGAGDMALTGGNRVIIDRSPELYLFTDAPCGRRFRGRYEFVRWEKERTTRDGRELTAIVFILRLVTKR
jgi:hypothetical protein